jgi:hypothetical protein
MKKARPRTCRKRPDGVRLRIRDLYFEIADALYNPTPRALTNTDGELLEFNTLTCDLRCIRRPSRRRR